MSNDINDVFDVFYYFWDYIFERDTSRNTNLYLFQHVVYSWQYLFDFSLEQVTIVSTNHSFVVVEVAFSGFHIDVQIIDYMILFSVPFFVQNHYVPFWSDKSLFDIDGQLQIESGIFDIVIEIEKSASIDLKVRVRSLELIK